MVMRRMKGLWSLWWLFGVVASQNITILSTNADATTLARSHPTVYGSIVIDNAMSGSIDLEGIKTILGDLVSENNTSLIGISSSTLLNITGSMKLSNLSTFSNLEFPNLENVGKIVWSDLPALSRPIFTHGVKSVSEIDIQRTNLVTLEKITPPWTTMIRIISNPLLKTWSIPLVPTDGYAEFKKNALLSDIDLGNVTIVGSIYLKGNISIVNGLENLKYVKGFFRMDTTAAFNCEQFIKIGHGNIGCKAPHSEIDFKGSTLDMPAATGRDPNEDIEEPVSNPKKIIIAVVVPVLSTAIILCIAILLYRKRVKTTLQVHDPEIAELPLGGHNEKSELETREKPGELAILMPKKPPPVELPVHATSPYSNIIDVAEMDHFFTDGEGARED